MVFLKEAILGTKIEEKPKVAKKAKKSKKKDTSQTSRSPRSMKGREIQEPTMGVTFTVVDDDVVGSVVADKEGCAAAQALCRLPDIEHAWVFRNRTLIRKSDGTYERYMNPGTLAKAVDGYDRSAGLFPAGEYELRPLKPSARKEAKAVWNNAHRTRHGGKRPYKYGTAPSPLRKK